MASKRGFALGNAHGDQNGQAFAELLLILAPLSVILAFTASVAVIASSH